MNLAVSQTVRRYRHRVRTGVVCLVVAALVVACSSSASDGTTATPSAEMTATSAPATDGSAEPASQASAEEAAAQGTYPVGFRSFDLTDESRDTPANGEAPGTEGRALPTLAFYPADGDPGPEAGTADAATEDAEFLDGRFPLIVFSHGLTGRATFYRGELAAIASAGYVVLAPDYPLSNFDAPGKPTFQDVGNQPGDASYLLDVFLEPAADGPIAAVGDHIDKEHIGAVGHSLGAMTSLGLGYADCCADERVDAVASWAGSFLPLMGGANPAPGEDRPLLLVHGDKDETVPYASSESAFDAVDGPRWLITLPGSPHVTPFLTPSEGPVARVVTTATIDFFDAQVKGDPEGIDRMEQVVADAGEKQATIESVGV